MTLKNVTLDDKYTATSGNIFLSGIQALVRLPMMQRQRDLADHPLDLPGIGQARDEEAARPRARERLAALDHLIDQRVVIGLRL